MSVSRPARVLIADDQPDVLEALRMLLKSSGLEVVTASSPVGALASAEEPERNAARGDRVITLRDGWQVKE